MLGNRVVIRAGSDGGVVTRIEYMIAQLASEEKLTKKTSNRIIKMVKRDDFVAADIRTDRIQHIEAAIEKQMVAPFSNTTFGSKGMDSRTSNLFFRT